MVDDADLRRVEERYEKLDQRVRKIEVYFIVAAVLAATFGLTSGYGYWVISTVLTKVGDLKNQVDDTDATLKKVREETGFIVNGALDDLQQRVTGIIDEAAKRAQRMLKDDAGQATRAEEAAGRAAAAARRIEAAHPAGPADGGATTRAEQAATRSEGAALRAESAANRVQAAAQRAEAAAEKVERMISKPLARPPGS